MASKGGVIAVGSIAGLLALFAFTRKAKAATKRTPVPEDLHSKEACDAYKSSRSKLIKDKNQLESQLNSVNNALQAAVDAGDEAYAIQLAATRQGLINTLATVHAAIADLNGRIIDCD